MSVNEFRTRDERRERLHYLRIHDQEDREEWERKEAQRLIDEPILDRRRLEFFRSENEPNNYRNEIDGIIAAGRAVPNVPWWPDEDLHPDGTTTKIPGYVYRKYPGTLTIWTEDGVVVVEE